MAHMRALRPQPGLVVSTSPARRSARGTARHAWVEGALDSAWRAVYELLVTEPAWRHLLCKFFSNWGYNAEWFAAPELGELKAPAFDT